jgi:hypothetical protein
MKFLKNEQGIAMTMVLILSVIALAVTTAMIFMITARTQFSGMQKRYYSALEASKGGSDLTRQIISLRGDATSTASLLTNLSSLNAQLSSSIGGCTATSIMGAGTFTGLAAKLNASSKAADGVTSNWGGGCNNSLTIDPTLPATFDMTFDFAGAGLNQKYTVYAKIVDTVEGNSAGGTANLKTAKGVIASGEISVQPLSYLYTIEIDAVNASNPAEQSKLSVLYQY